ncbi:MAG: hypothetical protein Q8M96_02895, partial [Rubrivivax sp.]|nr:hypothetical protein [Rubrivivax sp.]
MTMDFAVNHLGSWDDLLNSVKIRRSYDALFFKPVCLITTIDGVLNGEIRPDAIDPDVVMERFRLCVWHVYPQRAELGWRPFWHLSNDDAWVFTKLGRRVKPGDFGLRRKPESRGQLLSRIDHVGVPTAMLPLWRSPDSLRRLREALLAMLETDDDEASQTMAAALRSQRQIGLVLPSEDPTVSRMLSTRV